jgi:hypothetical protein
MEQTPGRNPLLCDAGTHVCTPILAFVNGRLRQKWLPADATKHDAEWREVPDMTSHADTPSVYGAPLVYKVTVPENVPNPA